MRCMVEMGAQFIRRHMNKLRLSVWGIAGEGCSTVHGEYRELRGKGQRSKDFWLANREEGIYRRFI